ncbi:unnamed protein product [Gongylonema pulchrum]|uniref:Neur_chan_LBD domain-containing protein n=1 Tax=Gongylonema pulchrum TaxID=637853 RepID=A0A183DRH3_9BILA|nr:unnamed protein product [Gongylonema pulchrum]
MSTDAAQSFLLPLLGILLLLLLPTSTVAPRSSAEFEGQLYQDLLYNYNKIPRPVKNSTDILTVKLGASLIRIIDVVSLPC